MGALLSDPCCLLGLGAAGLVVAVATVAVLVRGGQMLAGRLAAGRANGSSSAVRER